MFILRTIAPEASLYGYQRSGTFVVEYNCRTKKIAIDEILFLFSILFIYDVQGEQQKNRRYLKEHYCIVQIRREDIFDDTLKFIFRFLQKCDD